MSLEISGQYRVIGFVIFGLIILANVIVGIWAGKKVKDTDDYFVAGRNLGKVLVTGTQLATWIGGAMTVAWVSYGYSQGFAAFWYCALQGIGPLFAAFFLIKFFRAKKFTSLPDFFTDTYKNKIVTAIITLVVMIIPITWVASQFAASARMMQGVLGIDFTVGVIIAAVVVMGYSVFGGFTSVVYTDVLQFGLLFILFLIVAPQPLAQAGGIAATIKALPSDMSNLFQLKGMPSYAIIAYMIYGLTEFLSNQTAYQRIYAADTAKTAKFSLIVTGVMTVIWGIFAPLVGMAIHSLNPNLGAADTALSWFLGERASAALSMAFLACVMMATMSTADSCLNSLSVNVSHDLYKNLIKPDAADKKVLAIGRWVSLIFGLVSVYWALQGGSIVQFFNYSAGLSAGPITGIVLFTVFGKKIRTPVAAGSGLVAGVISGLIATQIPALTAIVGGGLLLSFPITLIVAIVVGAATKGKNNNGTAPEKA